MGKPASIDLGPYQLLERIGEGGSGQIYRATGPDGLVAIKLLGPAADMDEAARARFSREIAVLGQLAHPNLVSMLDHGIDAELGLFLVLPLLAGANLRATCAGGALCPEAALLLIQPIVHATAALHAAGFVHRDLKPENVIAGPDGAITVIDLGLAWRDGMTRHTDTGAAVGSVGYMAPEQIEGRAVDDRADVWALGVMIYEWIAGKRPFQRARPAEEAAAMLLGAYPRLDAVDRRCDAALADLVARCLSIEPSKRPTSAELAAAIDPMIDWTDTIESDRAAAIAAPAAYLARIAPVRMRRIERLARAALEESEPFVALALCDRGLAYSPDDPRILAVVAAAEAATGSAKEAVSAATAKPTSAPAIETPVPAARTRSPWPWVGGGVGVVIAGVVVYSLLPARDREPAPVAAAPAAVTTSAIDPRDRELVGDFISLFGQALEARGTGTTPPRGEPPTTAKGWLQLAGTQAPEDAVVSIRQALALSPTWLEAQVALCAALAASKNDGAVAACDAAIRRKPDDVGLLVARGIARLQAGDPAGALADLDRVVGADPDPKWRRLRAKARTAAGDTKGAASDLANACQLGDAAACPPR